MNSKLTVDDPTLKKQIQLKELQLKYIYAYILKRMQACPETACTINLSTQGLVEHILEAHKALPKYIIQFEQYGEVEVHLRNLDHGQSYCILVLLIAISSNENDIINDRTTMPLMVMAAKISPCGPVLFNEFAEGPLATNVHLMNPGELLMIWICGHLQNISSLIRVKTMNNVTNEYAGSIHSVADNNFNPNEVFTRGNCLLIPANNAMQLTDNEKIPLKIEVQLSIRDE